jgi:carboxylate-amine ligase
VRLRARPGDHDRVRTVGVEEELLVVDPSGTPVALGPDALVVASRRGEGETVAEHDAAEQASGADDEGEPGAQLVPELKEQQLELGTTVCADLTDVAAELRYWRGRADSAARSVGARVAALASAPVPVQPSATRGERYQRMVDVFGVVAADQLTCGCHVHVSVDDDEEGVAVLDRIRIWLPVLVALTANSPFWLGRDTGYASYRSLSWGQWPSAGPTGVHGSATAYRRLVEDLLATDTVLDQGMLYFDARLSASWPTVEVRVADVALQVEDAVLLAGLVRGLVDTAAEQWRAGGAAPGVRTELLRVAGWRAARSGLSGDLVHPRTGRPAPAADVLAALVEHVRPALVRHGDEELVDAGVAELLRRGSGAVLQRAVHEETADLAAVVRAAVTATHGS